MSTFRVYGMTECKARQLARSSTHPHARETVDEYEERVQERFEKIMESARQVRSERRVRRPSIRRTVYSNGEKSGTRQKPLHQVSEKGAGGKAQQGRYANRLAGVRA